VYLQELLNAFWYHAILESTIKTSRGNIIVCRFGKMNPKTYAKTRSSNLNSYAFFYFKKGSSNRKCARVTPHRDLHFTGCIYTYCETNVKTVCRTACETLPKPEFSSTTISTLNTCMFIELYRGRAKTFPRAHHRNRNGGVIPLTTNLHNRRSVVGFTHRPDYPKKKAPSTYRTRGCAGRIRCLDVSEKTKFSRS